MGSRGWQITGVRAPFLAWEALYEPQCPRLCVGGEVPWSIGGFSLGVQLLRSRGGHFLLCSTSPVAELGPVGGVPPGLRERFLLWTL